MSCFLFFILLEGVRFISLYGGIALVEIAVVAVIHTLVAK